MVKRCLFAEEGGRDWFSAETRGVLLCGTLALEITFSVLTMKRVSPRLLEKPGVIC